MRNTTYEMKEVEEEADELRKYLNSKVVEIEKLKKEGISHHNDN
jgi:hypothetical protein